MADPITAAIVIGATSGVLSASQTLSAGKIADIESKTEAKQIETAAASREADRKEDLNVALSSQMAGAGARGIGFEGSPLAVLQEDERKEKEATRRDTLQSQLAAQSARTRGKVAKSQSKGAAFTSLLSAGASAAGAAGTGEAKKGAKAPAEGN
jgi:hypothetical protein